ncbi:Glycosyltransferase Family 59 protein [Gigaspora rosea]|uniref:Dol-P-Glc:Glc(2)Man(9)GlcNAc(2)-PP-Dol alpha-1,2-glucosyltransferase n=1 Tax=Gigaspora rosea TaxID=44941 RepID=A0A397VH47_9GLOM|nr:Glycosyltransferase Family 59 protein [Gigaspora rosea]
MATKLILFLIHVAIINFIANLVNTVVPDPYMDEIFHIPQAQRYCEGNYHEWDPKLTTPPGLYIISNLIILPLSHLVHSVNFCSIEFLRATNILFSIGLYVVFWKVLAYLHPYQNKKTRAFNAFVLTSFPVNWFYNFLYYTDSGSTFFILWSYLLALKREFWMSAMVSGVGVFFRQTNIGWVCFILGVSVIDVLSDNNFSSKHFIGILRPVKNKNIRFGIAIQEIFKFTLIAIRNLVELMIIFFPYILVILSFIYFLIWNGGVVLGDKANHIAVLHFPQIFYFISFVFFFAITVVLKFKHIKRITYSIMSRQITTTIMSLLPLMILMAFLIHNYTHEHPFLLSDNRHYTFYIWKNIYRRHYTIKYILIPCYIVAGWILWHPLASKQSFIWIMVYITATCITLVPSPLLEFRYFIIPYYIYRLNVKQPSIERLIIEFLIYACINYKTLYLFLWNGFIWESESDRIQRFMW